MILRKAFTVMICVMLMIVSCVGCDESKLSPETATPHNEDTTEPTESQTVARNVEMTTQPTTEGETFLGTYDGVDFYFRGINQSGQPDYTGNTDNIAVNLRIVNTSSTDYQLDPQNVSVNDIMIYSILPSDVPTVPAGKTYMDGLLLTWDDMRAIGINDFGEINDIEFSIKCYQLDDFSTLGVIGPFRVDVKANTAVAVNEQTSVAAVNAEEKIMPEGETFLGTYDGMDFYFRGINQSSRRGYRDNIAVNLRIVNTSSTDYELDSQDVSVNGIMIPGEFPGAKIPAGKTYMDGLLLFWEDMRAIGINDFGEINDIEFNIKYYQTGDSSNSGVAGPFRVDVKANTAVTVNELGSSAPQTLQDTQPDEGKYPNLTALTEENRKAYLDFCSRWNRGVVTWSLAGAIDEDEMFELTLDAGLATVSDRAVDLPEGAQQISEDRDGTALFVWILNGEVIWARTMSGTIENPVNPDMFIYRETCMVCSMDPSIPDVGEALEIIENVVGNIGAVIEHDGYKYSMYQMLSSAVFEMSLPQYWHADI